MKKNILLKLHYVKFDVCKLFFSKVIEEEPLAWPPPLVKIEKIHPGEFDVVFFLKCLFLFV